MSAVLWVDIWRGACCLRKKEGEGDDKGTSDPLADHDERPRHVSGGPCEPNTSARFRIPGSAARFKLGECLLKVCSCRRSIIVVAAEQALHDVCVPPPEDTAPRAGSGRWWPDGSSPPPNATGASAPDPGPVLPSLRSTGPPPLPWRTQRSPAHVQALLPPGQQLVPVRRSPPQRYPDTSCA